MKRIWLVSLSGALVTLTMALAVDDASAAYRAGVYRGGVARGAYYRPGLHRAGIYRGGVYGTRYGYRPGLRAAAAGLAVGAASTAAYYGDGSYYNSGYYNDDGSYASGRYRDTAYANSAGDRTYYNTADRAYDTGAFAGGVYRPAGVVGYGARNDSGYGYYPTRAIVSRSFVPAYSYYGPMCNPQVDSGCQ